MSRPAASDAVEGQGPISIIAGGGTLPLELADLLAGNGRTVSIVAIRGFAERETRRRASAIVDIVDVLGLIAALRKIGARDLVLVGGVRRPSAGALLALINIARHRHDMAQILGPLATDGDDKLLRGVVGYLEAQGFAVLGLPDIAPGLLAPAGEVNGRELPEDVFDTLATGDALLNALSPFDVGQGVVIRRRRVLAIEGPEGTDNMLRRVRRISRRGWFKAPDRGGVLIKLPKSGQDWRVDLPAIGPRTVARAAEAGLQGIVVGAGRTLILERQATIEAAAQAGLFIYGMDLPPIEEPA